MPLTADVKVGTRSILAYFVSKILPVPTKACASREPEQMISLNFLTEPFDRFASRSPKRARARAERLSKAAPDRALALSRQRLRQAIRNSLMSASAILRERALCAIRPQPRNGIESPPEAGHLRAQCRLAALYLWVLSVWGYV